jgi:hypothetical protein
MCVAGTVGTEGELAIRQLHERVPGVHEFTAHVAVGGQRVPEVGIVVVSAEDDAVTGPAADDGVSVLLVRGPVEVAASALRRLAEEEREERTMGIG